MLVGAARACRAERRPFSITDFVSVPDSELGVEPSPAEEVDREAGDAVNGSYPGLKALDAAHRVYVIEGFLSQGEASELAQVPEPEEFRPSAMRAAEEVALPARPRPGAAGCAEAVRDAAPCARVGHRNSSSLMLGDELEPVQRLRARIAALLPGLGPGHCFEPLALTRYAAGGFYSRHADGRRATVLVYLDGEGAVGGATSFPSLGLRVPPSPGSALLFFPTFADGRRKAEMVHVAEELRAGVKVVAQQWIDLPGQRDCPEEAPSGEDSAG